MSEETIDGVNDICAVIENANEESILALANDYQDEPGLLTEVFGRLYHLLQHEKFSQLDQVLNVVLTVMDKQTQHSHLQISGSEILIYIVNNHEKLKKYDLTVMNQIVRTLLNGMSMHPKEKPLLKNGCTILLKFQVPFVKLLEYKRLFHIILSVVSDKEQDSSVQIYSIIFIGALVSEVDKSQRSFFVESGIIETMLNLIEDGLSRNVCNDVLEGAWSVLWNITDEASMNCQRFLDDEGMSYFLKCLKAFPDCEELQRNMMGVLSNISEVSELRNRLMTEELLNAFKNLLSSSEEENDVSYLTAGVLANICSDGAAAWTAKTPIRDDILKEMVLAINRWSIEVNKNIFYRSLKPILRLLRCYDTPECQLFAVWALAKKTTMCPWNYCYLLEFEGGIAILQELINSLVPYARIKELAEVVMRACNQQSEKNKKIMEELREQSESNYFF